MVMLYHQLKRAYNHKVLFYSLHEHQFSYFIATMATTINVKSNVIDDLLITVNAPIARGKMQISQFPI